MGQLTKAQSINKINLIKLIFGRIFFIYGFAWFIITTLFIALCCVIYNVFNSDKFKRAIFFQRLSAYWINFLLRVLFIKIKIHNNDKIDTKKANIYIANHRSFLDIWLSTPLFPQVNFTIGKDDFANVPVFGIIYKMSSILVKRNEANSRLQSFISLQNCLNKNMSVCIYPEGKRNKSLQYLLPFQNGAFKLSVLKNVCIVPVIILYTERVLPANISFFLFPHQLAIHVLDQIYPKDFIDEAALKTYCYDVMESFLKNADVTNKY